MMMWARLARSASERIEELFLRSLLAGEELDVVDQEQVERVYFAFSSSKVLRW